MKKLSYDYVKKFFENKFCKLISKKYIGNHSKLKYTCSKGHLCLSDFASFVRSKTGCRICGQEITNIKLSYSYKYVKEFFEKNGYKLLSKKYKNARTHVRCMCPNGHKYKVVFYTFKKGCRCSKCVRKILSEKIKLSHDYVEKYIQKFGCELLEKYQKANIRIKIKCKCGEIFYTSFASFKSKKQHHCPKCGLKRRSGKNHYEWKKDRKQHYEEYLFRQRSYKMLSNALKSTRQEKIGHSKDMLGYTHLDLKNHINNHRNWKKVKNKKWHLDHIFPVQAFLNYNIKDIKIINALDNLQPLLDIENESKGDRYNEVEFKKWLIKKGIKI
jgi:hypothetical protein